MEKDEHFTQRQYLVNTTCGVVYNLSSDMFSKDVEEIGSTFDGELSGHCTSVPIYISNDGI